MQPDVLRPLSERPRGAATLPRGAAASRWPPVSAIAWAFAWVLAWPLGTPGAGALHAQHGGGPGVQASGPAHVTQRADSLFAAGDMVAARAAYHAVLRADSHSSRALYQLARLSTRGSAEQIALLAAYTRLEPDDAWGHLAYGEALRRGGRAASALQAFRRGLAVEPAEPELVAAVSAARSALRPAVEPFAGGSVDSDDNRLWTAGAALHVAGPRDARTLLRVARTAASNALHAGEHRGAAVAATTVGLGFAPATPAHLAVRLEAGLTWYDAAAGSTATPTGAGRIRASAGGRSTAELRATRAVFAATPQLIGNGVVLNEARVRGTVPVVGPIGVRVNGRLARIESDVDQANTRSGIGAGIVAVVAPLVELSLNGQRLGYARASEAGYFAPERADVAEVAVYAEHYPGDLVLALDAGVGAQRVRRFGEAADAWKPAMRVWGSLATSSAAAVQFGGEVEAERSQLEAPTGGTGDWQYASIRLFLRYRL